MPGHQKNTKNQDFNSEIRGVGNTKLRVSLENNVKIDENNVKTPIKHKYWFFTYNNWDKDTFFNVLLPYFDKYCSRYVIQEEIGDGGTPHLQGSLTMKGRAYFTSLQKLCKNIHWEKSKSIAADRYCMKDKSSTSKRWIKGDSPESEDDLISESMLRPWQSDILTLIKNKPDPRKITWIYDKIGNSGKTEFVRFLMKELQNKMLFCKGGKRADVMNLITNGFKNNKNLKLKCFVWDLPRDCGKISYDSVECIKDGMICNTKYESQSLVFKKPHVIVLCNSLPDFNMLSKDRWNVFEIGDNYSLTSVNV